MAEMPLPASLHAMVTRYEQNALEAQRLLRIQKAELEAQGRRWCKEFVSEFFLPLVGTPIAAEWEEILASSCSAILVMRFAGFHPITFKVVKGKESFEMKTLDGHIFRVIDSTTNEYRHTDSFARALLLARKTEVFHESV